MRDIKYTLRIKDITNNNEVKVQDIGIERVKQLVYESVKYEQLRCYLALYKGV